MTGADQMNMGSRWHHPAHFMPYQKARKIRLRRFLFQLIRQRERPNAEEVMEQSAAICGTSDSAKESRPIQRCIGCHTPSQDRALA